MPLPQHESFPLQPNESDSVWRYMDMARFMSLLEDSALTFASASVMADRWEGAYGAPTFAKYGTSEDLHHRFFLQETTRQSIKSTVFLSCWHVSQVESAAMWSIYQREGRGVAIRSTWESLTSSFSEGTILLGGLVSYVDYSQLDIQLDNALKPYAYKRLSFEHEHEARLLWYGERTGDSPIIKRTVDLSKLIHAVYIAPDSPSWYTDLVSAIVKRYGYEFPVRQSDLETDPLG